MFKNIKYHILFFIFIFYVSFSFSKDKFQYQIVPEISTSVNYYAEKKKIGKSEVIVTANKYATDAGKYILEN